MKTCHQWAKDHPLVTGVLLFFYLLYIFFPSLFSILFYSFPLVICTAILLGGSRIRSEKHHQTIKDIKKEDRKTRTDNAVSEKHHPRRAYLQPQMSRRTFGKDKTKEFSRIEDTSKNVSKDLLEGLPTVEDLFVHKRSMLEDIPMEEDFVSHNSNHVEMTSALDNASNNPLSGKTENLTSSDSVSHYSNHVKMSSSLDNASDNPISGKTENCTRTASRSDTESQEEDDEDDDDEPQEETNKAVAWTEDDQRNLMDLGSSEIERNKRLESLIAKRRARKLLSMQPRRNHIDYFGDYLNCYDHHIDSVGSIMVARVIDNGDHQPGSAPSVLLPVRNPFDLPYDPHEEKPILTGGGFDEEFFGTEPKDFCNPESFSLGGSNFIGELKDDPISKSLPSFFMKPRAADKPGYTRFRRESDAEESIKEIAEELQAQSGNDQTSEQQDPPQEDQLTQVQSDCNDQATKFSPKEEESQKSEMDAFTQYNESRGPLSSTESRKEESSGTKDTEEENIFQMDSEATSIRDEVRPTQDQVSVNKDRDDSEESSSSSSCETSININVSRNEAFRNSVRKVLTCLVRDKGRLGKEKVGGSSSDLLFDYSPTNGIPTKMEERSYYTTRHRHTPTYSIASDMQVEVSETGSPTMTVLDPNSPTDRDSLTYDGDVDKDVNSGDEDLWGTSPHPMKLGEFGAKFKLPDILEESNSRGSDFGIMQNASDPPTLSRRLTEEAEQAPEEGTASSLSPRSILPEENGKELIDDKSTNGDIAETRSSVSSSSEGLVSQRQGKSEHLAEYLANLPPSEASFHAVQDPGPSYSREMNAEEITIQDESNPMFEMDDEKEESKESKELDDSRENSEQSTTTSQSEAPKEISMSSNDYCEGEVKKEHKDEAPCIAEGNEDSRRLEDDSSLSEKTISEADNSFRELRVYEKEAILDSLSAACQEDVADQSTPLEEPRSHSDKEVEITSGSQIEGEVKVESLQRPNIHEESTSSGSTTGETNHVIYNMNKQEVNESSEEGNRSQTDKEVQVTSGSQIEGEVKVDSPQKSNIHEESPGNITGESNHVVYDTNKQEVHESSENSNRPQLDKEVEITLGSQIEGEFKAESPQKPDIHEESPRKNIGETIPVVYDMDKQEVSESKDEGNDKEVEIKPGSQIKGEVKEESPQKPNSHEESTSLGNFIVEPNHAVYDMNRQEGSEFSYEGNDKEMEITLGSQIAGEIKVESPQKPDNHEESTSVGTIMGETDHVVHGKNKQVVNVSSEEGKVKLPRPQSAMVEEEVRILSSRKVKDLRCKEQSTDDVGLVKCTDRDQIKKVYETS